MRKKKKSLKFSAQHCKTFLRQSCQLVNSTSQKIARDIVTISKIGIFVVEARRSSSWGENGQAGQAISAASGKDGLLEMTGQWILVKGFKERLGKGVP